MPRNLTVHVGAIVGKEVYKSQTMSVTSRSIWLRRCDPSSPNPLGEWRDLALSAIGNAAARETLVTATHHMAAIWTDLFQSMIASDSQLRWSGNGPGIGRDARIAYSSLLGRYLARAYLTEHEGVRILVPLDVAKRRFQETPYVIEKDPPSRGLEADWIGLDNNRLVIVEAKGAFDEGIKTWRGPSRPLILQTAIEQAERTAVFVRHPRRKLPAKRWAIASRWGTQDNHREPTLLAWDPEEEKLDKDDYQALVKILLRTDLDSVMGGLGHPEILLRTDWAGVMGGLEHLEASPSDAAPSERVPGDLWIRVGDQDLDPGFAAMVSPFGVRPLRDENDLLQVRQARNLDFNIAVASLSSRYVRTASQALRWPDEAKTARERSANRANRAGLTVVWPEAGEDVVLKEE